MALRMSNQINEAENPQRNKASAIAQIHRTQVHTPRNRIRGGGGGIALKPRRQQIPILMAPELQLYTAMFFKFWKYNAKRRISDLWQSSAILCVRYWADLIKVRGVSRVEVCFMVKTTCISYECYGGCIYFSKSSDYATSRPLPTPTIAIANHRQPTIPSFPSHDTLRSSRYAGTLNLWSVSALEIAYLPFQLALTIYIV